MKPCSTTTFTPFNNTQSSLIDNVESFSTIEPAVDLSILSPLAFARQAAGRF
jgi:hypothetical protein